MYQIMPKASGKKVTIETEPKENILSVVEYINLIEHRLTFSNDSVN